MDNYDTIEATVFHVDIGQKNPPPKHFQGTNNGGIGGVSINCGWAYWRN